MFACPGPQSNRLGWGWEDIHVKDSLKILIDLIREDGEIVYTQDWDTGGPGMGAQTDVIFKYRDKYWLEWASGVSGPRDEIIKVFPEPYIAVTGATESIACREMDADEIIKYIKPIDLEDKVRITINGNEYNVFPDGKVEPSRQFKLVGDNSD